MSTANAVSWHRDFGIENGAYPGFVASRDDLADEGGYAHAARQAFDLLELDGMFCSEQTPLVYFKEVDTVDDREVLGLHRKFWNHGTAPILVLVSPEKVRVYSGMARPESAEAKADGQPGCLVDTLVRTVDELEPFLMAVESGAYFREHEGAFDADSRVDRDLLRNLSETRDVLREDLAEDEAEDTLDALLCRLVFACYLFDREVIDEDYLVELGISGCTHLRDVLAIHPPGAAKTALYRLFRGLGKDFNGDLFSDDLDDEERLVDERHVRTLDEFFRGTDVGTGQPRFWPYDFGYIPVETISAIYERFLESDGDREGAFYTARFLTEIVLDTAFEGSPRLIGKRFLDPACGSGIFLVGLFNRLAWEWTQAHPDAPNKRRARELSGLLRESVYGIEKSRVACRIAAFSLYLAYLDQLSPRDIRALQRDGSALPRLVEELGEGSPRERGGRANIVCADFFAVDQSSHADFDCVVGNPPWGRAEGESLAARWCADGGKAMPDRQIATAFAWKAALHARADAPVCFVLPHGTLFNHGKKALEFQRSWFEEYRVERVLNLTDLRFFLFRDAIHPAIVVRYRNGPPDERSGVTEYWVPKVGWATAKADVVSVGPGDRTALAVADVIGDLRSPDAPQVWNRHFWPTPRDRRLLDRLMALPRLRHHVGRLRERRDAKPWVVAEGFQPLGESDDASRAKRLELPSRRFIDARSGTIDLFLMPDDCSVLPTSQFLARRRSNSYTGVFEAPHVLVTQGFKRIAFADFDVSFRHAVRGIHGPDADRNRLMFLACYLRSKLARYFTFHTSSNWGVYRPKVHVDELLRVPFPLPEQLDDPELGERLIGEVCEIVDASYGETERSFLARANAVESASARIEPLINEYFGIHPIENVLIEDTVGIVAPSAQPRPQQRDNAGLATCTREQGASYAGRLCATLNSWAGPGQTVRGSCTVAGTLGVGVAVLEKGRPGHGPASPDVGPDLLHVLRRIRDALAVDGGSLSALREVTVFEGDRLYILKPAARIHWTETAALNDADALAATLLSRARSGAG